MIALQSAGNTHLHISRGGSKWFSAFIVLCIITELLQTRLAPKVEILWKNYGVKNKIQNFRLGVKEVSSENLLFGKL